MEPAEIQALPRDLNAMLDHIQTLEQQIASMRAELDEHHQLATVGSLAGMVMHEINNLLAPVSGYAQLAQQRDDPALTAKALERAQSASQDASRIATALLDLAKAPSQKPAADHVTDVRSAIDAALLTLSSTPHKAGLQIDVEVDDLKTQIDPVALQQVILNLVMNAARAMSDPASPPGRLRISARQQGGQVLINVQDNGPGLPTSIKNHIGQGFIADATGSGIGLRVCAQLLEHAQGQLLVIKSDDTGTTFRVCLPSIG